MYNKEASLSQVLHPIDTFKLFQQSHVKFSETHQSA